MSQLFVFILIILGAISVLIAVFKFLSKNFLDSVDKRLEQQRERLKDQFEAKGEVLESNLKKEEQFIKDKKESIKGMIEKIEKELSKSQEKIQENEKERIEQFKKLQSGLEDHKKVADKLRESTNDLKNMLSDNQKRGRYGEEVAEDLLKTAGFVKGENYAKEQTQEKSSTRPDFTIFLPDGSKLNVDSKFPLSAVLKYQKAEEKEQREKHLKQFSSDVKRKVKDLAKRDYVDPEENTVDFVILFVPNEMVFSLIYQKLKDVWEEAFKKKVIMAGPFSFIAILRMVLQSYKNFRYQENLQEIIKLIKKFEDEYEKFDDGLETLGKRIKSLRKQYEKLSGRRARKLSKIVRKIKNEKEEKELDSNNKED